MRYQDLATILASASVATAQSAADWTAAYQKANASLVKLSTQDKINIVTGVGWNKGPCVGNTPAINSIGYPQLCLQDSPLGVRYGNGVTAFTPGIQAGATWDRDLMRQRGQFMGEEAKGCGVHVLLGPVAGPLGKIAQGGRNWEGFAADPYLAGIATAETVEGMQAAGVQANVKHYIANEQELNRDTISSNVDDRSMHELYLWPFADAVRANVASVMCAYNKLNGTWACEDDKSLNGLLKQELGFRGYVMTDWNAQHTTELSANAGLDMTMPGSDYNGGSVLWGPKLASAVSSGRVPQSRVDDMVRRILGAWYLTNQDSGYPTININANVQANHKTNVRAVARDGIVLLKNDDGILPLKKPKSLALIGSAAANNPQGINACVDRGCNTGALGMGWGSGTANYPYFVAPADAIRTRAQRDGTTITLQASDSTSAASAARGADAALVFLTADSGEGYITVEGHLGDRNDLNPWHAGNALAQAVAQANDNVVVVVHSVGPVLLETVLALPQVKAVVWAGLPSQESGNALVDVLYGDAAPSGKLPYTIAKAAGDYGTSVSRGGSDGFAEGLYIDYRHFDRANIAPRYEFGFGLSYTNFTYSAIAVDGAPTAGPATGDIVPGGRADLFETVATVTVNVANSGSVTGAEVAQLYVGYPSSVTAPPKQLRGFEKLPLAAGASGTATFALRRRDLSYWDVAQQNWVVPTGAFTISVGASSRDIRQTATLTVS
ncbi:beta-glucosidase 1 [Apiospora rasikravindrae]|uniref:beta-glucosidase n=1 Tax=Apiospora rasikravindrae TaxID=990691 RepID=A0ABR1U038_9PEZI